MDAALTKETEPLIIGVVGTIPPFPASPTQVAVSSSFVIGDAFLFFRKFLLLVRFVFAGRGAPGSRL